MSNRDTVVISIKRYNLVRRFWDNFYGNYLRGFTFAESSWTPISANAYKAYFEYINRSTKAKQKFTFTATFANSNATDWTVSDFVSL